MTEFFSLLALLSLVTLIQRAKRDAETGRRWVLWGGYIISSALAVYSDYSAGYIVAGMAIFALIAGVKGKTTLGEVVISHLVLIAALVPAGVWLVAQSTNNRASLGWIPMPTVQGIGATLLDFISINTPAAAAAIILALALTILGGMALRDDIAASGRSWSYLFLICTFLTPLALPIAASFHFPVFVTRTAMLATFALYIFFARGVVQAVRHRKPWSVLLLGAIIIVNLTSLNAAFATTINPDWRGATSYVRSQILPGDVLFFTPGYSELPFAAYWQQYGLQNPEYGYPQSDGLLYPQAPMITSATAFASAAGNAHMVWVIDGSGKKPSASAINGASLLNSWAAQGYQPVEQVSFHGVTVYRYTGLPVASLSHAVTWLHAGTYIMQHLSPNDLVLLHGSGASTISTMLNTYPHPNIHLVAYGPHSASQLLKASAAGLHTTWLATWVQGTGDPAGIANNWLYHHGPQLGSPVTFGRVRLYAFANSWTKG